MLLLRIGLHLLELQLLLLKLHLKHSLLLLLLLLLLLCIVPRKPSHWKGIPLLLLLLCELLLQQIILGVHLPIVVGPCS